MCIKIYCQRVSKTAHSRTRVVRFRKYFGSLESLFDRKSSLHLIHALTHYGIIEQRLKIQNKTR